jgi:4-amino-4-deoxy-L-arabinose transferase-like glycosyltransferase
LTKREFPASLLLFAWLTWAAFVLWHYYARLLQVVMAGRLPTLRDCVLVVIFLVGGGLTVPIAIRSIGVMSRLRRTRVVFTTAAIAAVPWLFVHPLLLHRLSSLGISGAPAIGEAIARAAIGIIGALLVGASLVASGTFVLRLLRWQTTSRIEQLVFAWTMGIGVVSFGSLLLAVAGLYRPLPLTIFISVLLVTPWLPVLRGAHNPTPAARLRASRFGEAGSDGWLPPLGGRLPPGFDFRPLNWRAFAWLSVIAAALLYGLVAAFAPEREFDALWYHLYLPRLWLESGRPVDLVQEYPSLYPLTWELVFGTGMTLGGVVGAKLLHFACLPLLAALVWRTARWMDVGAAAAAAFVVTTPTLLWEASTTYIDLALALHTAAAGYALARYIVHGERPWAMIAGLQLGLGAATKHLGIVVAIVAVMVFVIAAVRSGRTFRSVVRIAVLITLLAALLPSSWYLRSWLASGNPVFPEMYGVFGASPPERWDARTTQGLEHFLERFGHGRSAGALAALPWDATVHGAAFGGSLGPLFLVLLPVLLLTRNHPRGVIWIATAAAAYVAVWASPLSSFQLRFLMPIVPLLALLAAVALERASGLARGLPGVALLITAATIALAALNFPMFMRLHESDELWLTHVLRQPPLAVVIGRQSELEYLRRQVPSFAAWTAIDATLPPDARILTFTEGDHLYSHRWRVSHYATMARAAVWDAAGADTISAAEALRALRITHILFDRRELLPERAGSLALASAAFQQACVSEFDDGRHWVCRVDYSRLPGPAP